MTLLEVCDVTKRFDGLLALHCFQMVRLFLHLTTLCKEEHYGNTGTLSESAIRRLLPP